jgi:membrane fusion protein (multidrug efflux system)
MSKKVVGVVSVVLLSIAVGGGYWLGQKGTGIAVALKSVGTAGAPPSGAAPAVVSIEAIKVAKASMPQGITAVGSLRSDESITLRPEVAGRISAITFREGERVAKGAPLIKLDPSVTEAEAQQARANLTLAKAKYTRAIDLEKKGFISGQARDEAENNLRVSEAILAVAEAKLSKLTIAAPFSGIIGLRSVSIGDYVKEGADMVNLEAVDTLKVDFRVPEIYLTQVRVGQTLQMTLDAMPGKYYEGSVFAINPLIDAAGRSVVIRAQVRNQGTVLRPGMFARVRLLTRDLQDTLVVPEQAIVPQGDEWYVYRVVDGKALRTKVEIGQRRDGKTEIVRGLEDGEVVVTAGQLKLRDGVPVQTALMPSPPTAAAGADPDGTPAKTEATAPPTPKS